MSTPLLRALIRRGPGKPGAVVDPPGWDKVREMLHGPRPGTQRDFVMDSRSGVIGLAARGAGKSFGQAVRFHRYSASNAGRSSIFIALSAERARDIMLPAIWALNERLGLGISEVKGDNCVVWPNGYKVLFRGCKDRVECNKRRGTPWVVALWDECDAINSGLLEYDIHECVEPRLMDFGGVWGASGTPGPLKTGYWYKLSSGEAGYPVYEWDARDNPTMDAMNYLLKVLQRVKADSPAARAKWPAGIDSLEQIINDPKLWHLLPAFFVREYLGKWVTDIASLIYRLSPRNSALRPPFEPNFTTIGLDLGGADIESFEDATLDSSAITVCQSASNHPGLWTPISRRLNGVSVQGLAGQCEQILNQEQYKNGLIYVDSASAGKIIEQTFRRMGLPVRHGIKGPKLRRIQLGQGAISSGDAQFLYAGTVDLREEATQLVWDDTRTLHAEKCGDDCWDSWLLAAMPHLGDYRQDHLPPPEGSDEAIRQQQLEEFEAALERAARDAEEQR